MSSKPVVLVIDDEPGRVALSPFGDFVLKSISPSDLAETDLVGVHVVLVDQVLDHWVPDPQPEFACRPRDGLALAAIVRSHQRALGNESPAAVALYSGALQDLVNESDPQEHLVAMAFGLEWAFAKQRSGHPDLDVQVAALARAVQVLPRKWDQDNPDLLLGQVADLLGLKDQVWVARALVDVERCRPPMHRLSEWTDGLAILRWLLHRVLPYPCFLLNLPEMALRLRVDVDWLGRALQGHTLRDVFRSAEYSGALAGFSHARWWWAGIEHVLRSELKEVHGSFSETHAWLKTVCGSEPVALSAAHPVLTFDASGRFKAIEPMRECVRIQPDDWPLGADEPWCRIDVAKVNAEMRRLVVADHLETVQPSDIDVGSQVP